MSRQLTAALILAIASLPLSLVADASVIVFDSFLPSDGFSSGGFSLNDNAEYAASFVPSQSGPLSDVWFAASLNLVGSDNELDVRVRSDAAGVPGNVLETLHFSDALTHFATQPIHGTSSTGVFLSAGDRYWLTLAPNPGTSAVWHIGVDPPAPDRLAGFSVDGGPWQVLNVNNSQAFRIAVIPEPSTALLLATGIAATTAARRRRQSGR